MKRVMSIASVLAAGAAVAAISVAPVAGAQPMECANPTDAAAGGQPCDVSTPTDAPGLTPAPPGGSADVVGCPPERACNPNDD